MCSVRVFSAREAVVLSGAAKTLSQHAIVVLTVSVDGDIVILRDGTVVTTLLSRTGDRESVADSPPMG
jgi:hypothetical protein